MKTKLFFYPLLIPLILGCKTASSDQPTVEVKPVSDEEYNSLFNDNDEQQALENPDNQYQESVNNSYDQMSLSYQEEQNLSKLKTHKGKTKPNVRKKDLTEDHETQMGEQNNSIQTVPQEENDEISETPLAIEQSTEALHQPSDELHHRIDY